MKMIDTNLFKTTSPTKYGVAHEKKSSKLAALYVKKNQFSDQYSFVFGEHMKK